uniref:Uncharacterized protein n=1 Tax=Glossina austeni TaxID=7395 RepID=A0A1A9UX00_GLOAU
MRTKETRDNLDKRDFLKHIPNGSVKEKEAFKTDNNLDTPLSFDAKKSPFTISAKALRAKASKRIRKLAQPKKFEIEHVRRDPYEISKAALKAKPKKRIIELAQPKKYTARNAISMLNELVDFVLTAVISPGIYTKKLQRNDKLDMLSFYDNA